MDASTPTTTPFISPNFPDSTLFPLATIRGATQRAIKKFDKTMNQKLSADATKSLTLHPYLAPFPLALDDSYLYWATPSEIYRSPLGKFSKEPVTATKYALGDLSRMDLLHSGDWLIFLDTQDPDKNNFSIWTLRSLNLIDHSDIEIASNSNSSSPLFATTMSFSADNNHVVWANVNHSISLACDQYILSEFDLKTKVKQIIEQNCIENNYLITLPRVSENYMVVEKDLADSNAGGSNLLLYDLNTVERRVLTDDGRSSTPQFEYPWIVWKENRRFDPAKSIGIYNMMNGQTWSIPVDATDPTDPHLSGQWVYWTGLRGHQNFNSIFIYDLKTNQLTVFDTPQENQLFTEVVLYNDTLAWLLDLSASQASSDRVIEWNKFPVP